MYYGMYDNPFPANEQYIAMKVEINKQFTLLSNIQLVLELGLMLENHRGIRQGVC